MGNFRRFGGRKFADPPRSRWAPAWGAVSLSMWVIARDTDGFLRGWRSVGGAVSRRARAAAAAAMVRLGDALGDVDPAQRHRQRLAVRGVAQRLLRCDEFLAVQ